MGKYVNHTSLRSLSASAEDKCNGLLQDGATEIQNPGKWIPNLICVVNNGPFGAAGYAHDEKEYEAFNYGNDPRPKRWFVWDKAPEYAQ